MFPLAKLQEFVLELIQLETMKIMIANPISQIRKSPDVDKSSWNLPSLKAPALLNNSCKHYCSKDIILLHA